MDASTAEIPVIICTTSLKWLRANVDEAWLTAKGVDVLPKPFDIGELLTIVRDSLARAASRSGPPPSANEQT
jgi:DNA-binding response OmpR family regulator